MNAPALNPSELRARAREARALFPILSRPLQSGKPLVFLDSAASSQKPASVIEAMDRVQREYYANVHRGVYEFSQRASNAYEAVREKVGRFLGVKNEREIVFTSGTTASINLVASSFGRANVQAGDAVVVTRMDHHANFVPWQALAKEKGAEFLICELTSDFKVDLDHFRKLMEKRPKLAAFPMMSNALGTINPVKELAEIAHAAGATVLVDGAQGAAHATLDLKALGPIDFFAFSAHKVFGPTGVGVLWGRESALQDMPPYQFGGDMIARVEDESTLYNELPHKFEAGTPNIVGVIGLGAAIDAIFGIGRPFLEEYDAFLTREGLARLSRVGGLRVFGPKDAAARGPVFSFAVEGVHPHDMATLLDLEGIAVRAGHHCAQPLMKALKVSATTRASLACYNTVEEIDALAAGIEKAKAVFLR